MADQEYLDIFDDNLEHIGIVTREEAHKGGHWHQSFHCWLIRRDKGCQYVLFQQRGPRKKVYPGKYDITAAGHLTAGETEKNGIRELNEELGLSIAFENLIRLGIRCNVAITGSIIDREFCHVFMLENSMPLENYKLQPEEVTGIVQMELRDGMRLFAFECEAVPITGFSVDEKGIKHSVERYVSRKDIVPCLDNYYMKVFIMAERYFQGRKYLTI